MMNKKYILVLGYGWSGSSAVVDLLKEYSGNIEADVEFRVIKDPYGITDLYNALVTKGDPLNYDIAIKDFLWYVKKLNRMPKKFSNGLGYKKFFGDDFMDSTFEYINNLTDYQYDSHWWMFDFKKSTYTLLKEKIYKKLKIKDSVSQMYFSTIDENLFIQLTRKYLEQLFNKFFEAGINNVILDQGISVLNCVQEMRYFNDAKVVIIDRDPRDIYTDLCVGNYLIGKELSKSHDVMKYVKWHKAYRKNYEQLINSPDILLMNFEDVILNYEVSLEKLEIFLGLDSESHVDKFKYLKPGNSKKNIGIWKDYISDDEKKIFDQYLKEYYYDGKKIDKQV